MQGHMMTSVALVGTKHFAPHGGAFFRCAHVVPVAGRVIRSKPPMAMALARAPDTPVCTVLRAYQSRLVDEASSANSVIVLPTGSGKTLIAAELVARCSGRSIIFVPTILLVKQQATALREWLNNSSLVVAEYHGGQSLATSFDVLVTTPKAFEIAQAKQGGSCCPMGSLQWDSFRFLAFDEVHHVLKDHPYRKLATALKKHVARGGPAPHVIGLTASLTYAVKKPAIESAIEKLCAELRIAKVLTASDEELKLGGYSGSRAAAEVRCVGTSGASSALVPLDKRKPHQMLSTFNERIESGTATKFTLSVEAVVASLEAIICELDPSFESPRANSSVSSWEQAAHIRATQHQPQSAVADAIGELTQWYGVLKVLCVSWEEADYVAAPMMKMYSLHNRPERSWASPTFAASLRHLFTELPTSFLRLDQLKDELVEAYDRSEDDFRGVLFVEQRITTHVLEFFVQSDRELSDRFRPNVLYATSSSASPTLSLTRTAQQTALTKFKSGVANLLICTNAAEEGMDVPAANFVMRFDNLQTAVSLVQGRGRARQEASRFVVLSERKDRTVQQLEEAEKVQREVCASVSFAPRTSKQQAEQLEVERHKQTSRERNAIEKLELRIEKCGGEINEQNSLGLLNQTCKATKVDLVEVPGLGEFRLRYESVLRQHEGVGRGNKKDAKRKAAVELLSNLRAGMRQKV